MQGSFWVRWWPQVGLLSQCLCGDLVVTLVSSHSPKTGALARSEALNFSVLDAVGENCSFPAPFCPHLNKEMSKGDDWKR